MGRWRWPWSSTVVLVGSGEEEPTMVCWWRVVGCMVNGEWHREKWWGIGHERSTVRKVAAWLGCKGIQPF